MTYLFDPVNWQWLVTGSDVRFILEGFAVNLEIAAVAMVLSLALGLLLALARVSKLRLLSTPAGLWVDLWRNLPLIFMILYLGLAMPEALRDGYESLIPAWFPEGLQSGRVLAALTALVLYNSAVFAEIMRSGILSLERGQSEAAASLGLTYVQQMRLVILPQGLRRMVPATVSQLITLNKDTTLVSIIAIQEVMRHGRIVTSSNFFGGVEAPILQVFLFIGFLFIVVNLALSRLSRRLEVRQRRRTGTTLRRVRGLEDQVAAESDVRASLSGR
jgi:His/Glu/Gln/Arg/opine family amino acid ABC transporter permease subunit